LIKHEALMELALALLGLALALMGLALALLVLLIKPEVLLGIWAGAALVLPGHKPLLDAAMLVCGHVSGYTGAGLARGSSGRRWGCKCPIGGHLGC
jgi:hypothetical protein